MIKVYVACEFGRMDEAVELALDLQRQCFDVVSTWLLKDTAYDPKSLPKAIRDYLQVKECDLLVWLTGKSVNTNCEVGLAMGMGKPVVCVGEFSGNIFTTIPYLAEWMKRDEVVEKLKERYQYA